MRRRPVPWPSDSAVAIVFLTAVLGLATAAGCSQAVPAVKVGDGRFEVEVAQTPAQRARGLSGRDSLAPGTGMLFVFETGRASAFWMKGMRFPLDFVWIGEDCSVVHTTIDVPPSLPGTDDYALPRYVSAPTSTTRSRSLFQAGVDPPSPWP